MRLSWVKYFVVAILLLLIGEAMSISYLAQKVEKKEITVERFQRFWGARYIFPKLGISEAEKKFGIEEFAGQFTEESQSFRSFSPDVILGHRPRSGSKVTKFGSPILVNSQGFVSLNGSQDFFYKREKENGTFRVIVVGGSTVYGIGAEPQKSLPASIYYYLLPERGSKNLEVINAGVGGYTSVNELLYLMSELVHFNPDLVIVYNGWNDLIFNNHWANTKGADWFPLRTRIHESQNQMLISIFETPSKLLVYYFASLGQGFKAVLAGANEGIAFWKLAKSLLGRSGLISFKGLDRWLNNYNKIEYTSVPYDKRTAEEYQMNLQQMAAIAKIRGFKMAFFLQPLMGVTKKELTFHEKESFGTMSNQEAENRRAYYADVSEVFRRFQKIYQGDRGICAEDLSQAFREEAAELFVGTGHLNGLGNKIIAGRIHAKLKKCGFW